MRQVNFPDQLYIIFLTRPSKPNVSRWAISKNFRDVEIYLNCLIMRGCIITTKKKLAFFV